jgi:hypothetical protein
VSRRARRRRRFLAVRDIPFRADAAEPTRCGSLFLRSSSAADVIPTAILKIGAAADTPMIVIRETVIPTIVTRMIVIRETIQETIREPGGTLTTAIPMIVIHEPGGTLMTVIPTRAIPTPRAAATMTTLA